MLGLSESQNSLPAQVTDADKVMYDDDGDEEGEVEEEVMATGRLPMYISPAPIHGFMSHLQESSQRERARPSSSSSSSSSSSHSTSMDVFLDIIPADHWHGPNWRSMQFPPYLPDDGDSNSNSSLAASSSGSEATELQRLKRKRPQASSGLLVASPQSEVAEVQRPQPVTHLSALESPPARRSPQQSPQLPQSPQEVSLSPLALKSPREMSLSPPAPVSPRLPPATMSAQEPCPSPPTMHSAQEQPRSLQALQSTQESAGSRRTIRPSRPLSALLQLQPEQLPVPLPSVPLPRELLAQPPLAPPLAQLLDVSGLRDLGRSFAGHRYAYVEQLVKAWAQGHCLAGDSFAGAEITLMSQIARQSPVDLGRSLRNTHSICLQRCADTVPDDAQAARWRMVAGSGSTAPTRPAASENLGLLSQLVATMAQYAAMLPVTAAETGTAASEEYRPPKRAAATRVADYSEACLLEHSERINEAADVFSTRCRRSGTAHAIRALRGRAGRLRNTPAAARSRPSVSVDLQTSPRGPAGFESPSSIMDSDHGEAAVVTSTTPSKRGNLTTADKKRANKEKREAAIAAYERSQDAGKTIQDLLVDEKVVRRLDSPRNCPSIAELAAVPFLPIIFRARSDEPAHYVVDCRRVPGAKLLGQAQSFQEYGVDGYPVPVVPDRWLRHQLRKYRRWLGSEEVQVVNLVDDRTCQRSFVFGPPMCCGCVSRQTDCPCRFRGIRVVAELTVATSSNPKLHRYIVAPMFESQVDSALMSLVVKPAPISLFEDSAVGRSGGAFTPEEWQEFYPLLMTAPALLQALDALSAITMEHSSATPDDSLEYGVLPGYGCSAMPCVYRTITPGSRQSCDVCGTSILSVCFTCCLCATEMCVGCFVEWDDTSANQRVSLGKGTYPSAHLDPDDASSWAKRYKYCKKFNGTGKLSLRLQSQHVRRQFFRTSQFTAADIRQVLGKVQGVIDLGAIYPDFSRVSCAGVISDTVAQAFERKIAFIEERTRRTYPHTAWEMPAVYVEAGELSTAEFSVLWRRGVVIVVRGLLAVLNSEIWQPEWWIREFGDEMVSILDCANGAEPVGGDWPLRSFYRLFDGTDKYKAMFKKDANWAEHRACVRRGILKLKDWPPTEDFARRLPEHFRCFMRALPFPEYTQREGRFNLVNRLPDAFVPPDLGPKMYCAYGSSDGEGGSGTTNMHCDMSDAVNVMAYAPPEFLSEHDIEAPGIWTRDASLSAAALTLASPPAVTAAAAVWDIYPPKAIGDLRRFIGGAVGIEYSSDCTGPVAAKHGDPIHNQETYLTQPMRRRFFEEYKHKSYHVFQNPGDAVFVPAGCAHQVCNNASAIKIAMDFVSPERVEHSRRLTEEFRHLNVKHPRNRDLLQLSNILWWSFAGEQGSLLSSPSSLSKQPAMSDSIGSEDERPQPKKPLDRSKSGKRPAKQPKKPTVARGSGSKARPGPRAKDTGSSNKDGRRPSLSTLSSPLSSFSIDEADDSDGFIKS
ncbi:hypothetical protein IW152_004764 [Coemansia sp. BCRC 34962]|nr:hypothetical protein IW152_004764 [Coemansia sp. BCRC 34962]